MPPPVSVAGSKFQPFVASIGSALIDFAADTFNVSLSNAAPLATYTLFSSIVEISAVNGYPLGGISITGTAYSQSGGVAAFTGSNVVFTAVGGSIGPFRYVVVYDLTSATNPLVAWYDYGSAVTLLSGQSFTVDFTTNTNILTIT